MPLIIPANSITGGYEVDNSLRFNSGSSDYLERTPASAGNQKKWTWSAWIKRSKLGDEEFVFYSRASADNDTRFYFESDTFRFQNTVSNVTNTRLWTNRVFRDVSAFYNIIISYDSTVASPDTNSIQMFVNGVKETSFSATIYPSQNQDTFVNDDVLHTIGRRSDGASNYYNGYMAEVCLIDGQALDHTSFGEFDEDSGIWKPKAVSGLTFGTNGFYLDFEDSGALGDDVSDNGNDFTVNNLTSIDQTTDTPSNNWCTANPIFANNEANISSASFSNGNTTYTTTVDSWTFGRGTFGISVGKWYMEAKVTKNGTGEAGNFAIVPDDETDTNGTSIGLRVNSASNEVVEINAGTSTTTFTDFSTGDIVKLAVDLDNGKLWIGKNNEWWNDNNSSATLDVSNPDITGINTAITYLISLGNYRDGGNNNTWDLNFGNPPFTISSGNSDGNSRGNFEYEVPDGYFALCTSNLAEHG